MITRQIQSQTQTPTTNNHKEVEKAETHQAPPATPKAGEESSASREIVGRDNTYKPLPESYKEFNKLQKRLNQSLAQLKQTKAAMGIQNAKTTVAPKLGDFLNDAKALDASFGKMGIPDAQRGPLQQVLQSIAQLCEGPLKQLNLSDLSKPGMLQKHGKQLLQLIALFQKLAGEVSKLTLHPAFQNKLSSVGEKEAQPASAKESTKAAETASASPQKAEKKAASETEKGSTNNAAAPSSAAAQYSAVSGADKAAEVGKSSESKAASETKKAGETKEAEKPKSIWDMIGDFFKSFAKVFSFIMDFVVMLLNKIPGIGNLINLAWQAVKLVAAAIQGDIKAVLQSLASMIPFVGGEVGKLIGIGIKIVMAVIEVVKAVIKAVQSGDPMALMGIVSAVASGLGGMGGGALGKVGETLASAGKTIGKVASAVSSGITFIKGAVSGNVDQMFQGLAGGLGTVGDLVGGDTGKAMQYIGQGVAGVNHLANGRIDKGIASAAGALAPIANLPESKEMQKYVSAGLGIASSLASGKFDAAASTFLGAVTPLAKDSPALTKIFSFVKPAAAVIGGLASGKTNDVIKGATAGLQQLFANPTLQKATEWFGALAQTIGALAGKDPQQALATLSASAPVKALQQSSESGALQKAAGQVSTQAKNVFQSDAFQQMMKMIQKAIEDATQQQKQAQ